MAETPWLRWFAVDCEPLGRRRVWLLTGALGNIATHDLAADYFAVHVVVPTPAARQIGDTGEGRVLAPIGEEHHLVSVRLDATRAADDARVEAMVLLGYEDSFR